MSKYFQATKVLIRGAAMLAGSFLAEQEVTNMVTLGSVKLQGVSATYWRGRISQFSLPWVWVAGINILHNYPIHRIKSSIAPISGIGTLPVADNNIVVFANTREFRMSRIYSTWSVKMEPSHWLTARMRRLLWCCDPLVIVTEPCLLLCWGSRWCPFLLFSVLADRWVNICAKWTDMQLQLQVLTWAEEVTWQPVLICFQNNVKSYISLNQGNVTLTFFDFDLFWSISQWA